MSRFLNDINRLNNSSKSNQFNQYPPDIKLFQKQISDTIQFHFDLFSVDAGSFAKEHQDNGRKGFIFIEICELYENFLKDKSLTTDLDLVWVDSTQISDLEKDPDLVSQSWFFQLKNMVQNYDPSSFANFCLTVKNATRFYPSLPLPTFVLQLPIAVNTLSEK